MKPTPTKEAFEKKGKQTTGIDDLSDEALEHVSGGVTGDLGKPSVAPDEFMDPISSQPDNIGTPQPVPSQPGKIVQPNPEPFPK